MADKKIKKGLQTAEIMEEVVGNIRKDREKIDELLVQITECFDVKYNKTTMTDLEYANLLNAHISAGAIAAKYLESKQKSNEQLVKILSLVYKSTPAEEEVEVHGMDDDIFDKIKREEAEAKVKEETEKAKD